MKRRLARWSEAKGEIFLGGARSAAVAEGFDGGGAIGARSGLRRVVKTNPIELGRRAGEGHDLGVHAELADAAELGERAEEIALEGLLAAGDFVEGAGTFGVLDEDLAEGKFGGLEGRQAGIEDLGFDAGKAALQPGGADEGLDELGFELGGGAELAVEVGGELFERGGVFAGDDKGLGVNAEFPGVAAGGGLALDGVRAGGELRVGSVGGDLGSGGHERSFRT